MNANDLADRLEQFYSGSHIQKAAEVLRQQQTEIEALKKEAALQRLSDFTQEADNEPVAWRNLLADEEDQDGTWFYNEVGQGIPLYTYPVKDLTDEEIRKYILEMPRHASRDELLMFARAILRKAQEK